MEKVEAPWTDEQVRSLNGFQRSGVMHEFTCAHGHGALSAVPDGWLCLNDAGCAYRQAWAWEFMTDGSWRRWQDARAAV